MRLYFVSAVSSIITITRVHRENKPKFRACFGVHAAHRVVSTERLNMMWPIDRCNVPQRLSVCRGFQFQSTVLSDRPRINTTSRDLCVTVSVCASQLN